MTNPADQIQSQSTLIFSAAKPARKVRLILYFSIACLFAAVYAAYGLFTSFGTNPADGTDGQLASLGTRLAWSLPILTLGVAFSGGMFIYCTMYAVTISHLKEEQAYLLRTLNPFGDHAFNATDVVRIRKFRGQLDTGGISVDAPWIMLWVKRRKLPVIIDQQGERVRPRELSRLTSSKRS